LPRGKRYSAVVHRRRFNYLQLCSSLETESSYSAREITGIETETQSHGVNINNNNNNNNNPLYYG